MNPDHFNLSSYILENPRFRSTLRASFNLTGVSAVYRVGVSESRGHRISVSSWMSLTLRLSERVIVMGITGTLVI